MNILLRNNTGNQGKDLLINGFVVRTKVFNSIINELKLSQSEKPEQNYLIIGQRGAGKTTLLYRIKYAIEDDVKLKEQIIPIILKEEQYFLTELLNLWEIIAEHLDEIKGFENIEKNIESNLIGGKYDEEKAYDIIENKLKESKKKIIVFIENIDHLLKKFGKEGQQRLREVLSTSKNIRVIGSSTTYFDGIINYSDPFYDFFKIYQLNGLTKNETYKLLRKIAEQSEGSNKIENLLQTNPNRVEALRRLTGGNPRMISYLYQIFLDNANGKAIKDLYKLLDDLTFLYKSELDQLSTQQQKVIDVIARYWDAISVKELVANTRIESKHISSILVTLEKNQVVEKINTRTKNNLYRIKDRFMNIWYLMRFGKKKDKENIMWLVRFYDTWCDKIELSERVSHHIDNLLGGQYDNGAALDMVNTFLSCKNVSPLDKYKLLQTTKSALPKELISNLKLSQKEWFETIKDLVKRKKYDQAINALNEMGATGLLFHTYSYWIYYNKKQYEKAQEHLEWLFNEKQDSLTAFTLAELFEEKLLNLDKAIFYYNVALEKGYFKASFRLGQLFTFLREDYDEAIKYYEIAVENGHKEAIMCLATIYYAQDNLIEAKKLCLLAIEKGIISAYVNLGLLLKAEGNIDGAIEALHNAVEKGDNDALIVLGYLYLSSTSGNEFKAKEIFEIAINNNVIEGYSALGRYLLKIEKNTTDAIRVLNEGVKQKDSESAHLLAHHYQNSKEFDKAEKYFIKSYNYGKRTSLLCLANCAFNDGLESRKEFILNLFEKEISNLSEPIFLLEYCKLLVWNGEFKLSAENLVNNEQKILEALENRVEEYKEDLLSEITSYFIRLLAVKQYNLISNLFNSERIDYKQIIKPVYFAFMTELKDEFPNEYLKAGSEMSETIKEILEETQRIKNIKRH
ncbi:hypothetical protein [uncultured Flavobacterium sp.]|uniref:hypothetical protein n=1 Tax=uncultured Flavobacterium sp. TaxID=165435 RepID=UPI002595AE2C|nr:hypothetical protein [uncultured Flavobacterium sp.]